MRRSDAVEVVVDAPTVGLVTSLPSSLADKRSKRAIVVAQNVRAEFGVLRNAPGYERVVLSGDPLDSAPNLIYQSNITNTDSEVRTAPIIGTQQKLFTVRRRATPLVCSTDDGGGGGGSFTCPLTVGFLGDSGRVGSALSSVASLIKSWSPDLIIHLGDMAYADGGTSSTINDYEECIGQYFYEYVGGYNGVYGVGPAVNKFFPVLGNHDWDDSGIGGYYDFFQLPGNERYFSYKRGPIHFVHVSGYSAQEPDGISSGSTQGLWVHDTVANSDCPWVIIVVHFPPYCSDISYYPGISALQWLGTITGVQTVVAGHAHNAEVLYTGGVYYFISGTGGHDLRAFHEPPAIQSQWKYNADYGALRLDANRTSLTWKFYQKTGTLLNTVTMTNPRTGAGVSGICYIGSAAKRVFTLQVIPSEAWVEVGFTWPYQAIATYEDGSIEDVTLQSVWTSSDETIGTVGPSSGVALGVSPGSTTITAEFEDKSATATLFVLYSCLDLPMEVAFLVERTDSMNQTAEGASRLQHAKDGIEICIDTFRDETDKIAIASFAGTYASQTEDATLDQALTSDFDAAKTVLQTLSASGDSGLSAGLDVVRVELISHHTAGNLRAAIVIVDGPSRVTDPGGTTSSEAAAISAAMSAAATSAAQIRALEDTLLVIIGYSIPSAYETSLRALATAGYYYAVSTPTELKAVLGQLSNTFCLYDGYYYYVDDTDCASPQLDYNRFLNWDVVRGCTDLCGTGSNGVSLWDVWPGQGLYLDLAGTNPLNAVQPVSTTNPQDVRIQSKLSFSFVTGKTYRLSFKLAGVGRNANINNNYPSKVLAAITNGILSETITFNLMDIPWTTYSYNFTVGSPKSGKITFEQLPGPTTRYNATGNFLDDIKLENVTDAVVMLDDNFDNENPCTP